MGALMKRIGIAIWVIIGLAVVGLVGAAISANIRTALVRGDAVVAQWWDVPIGIGVIAICIFLAGCMLMALEDL